jgi:hypothetical protein
MLPHVEGLFTLVQRLAKDVPVTEVPTSKWLVQRHGLAPLVARSRRQDFRTELAATSVAWERVRQTFSPLVTQLCDAGVRIAMIKGASYATRLYRHTSERPMTDVDMLVQPRDAAVVARVLERAGFVRSSPGVLHHATAWERGPVVIDVHRSILAPGRSSIDLEAVWSRTTNDGWPAGTERLDITDELVFHFVHMARNRLRGPLIHVVDAERLLRRADIGVAARRAREWRLSVMFELVRRFVADTMDLRREQVGGRFGPTRDELALFVEPTTMQKIAFDLAVSESPTQILARSVSFGANRLLMWSRKLRRSY